MARSPDCIGICLVPFFPFSFASSYDAVNAMLLNEFLKEHRKIQEMQKAHGALTTKPKKQAVEIQRVTAQVELNKSASGPVAHNR